MAVPSSGTLSLLSLAKEKVHDDYTSGVSVTGPISLKDLTLGGNANGSNVSYDVTNGFSPSHPDNDESYGMQEFYSYDHDYAVAACNIAYREGNSGTFTFPINLGSDTGTVRIEYQAYGIPDKFVFAWNGNTYTSGTTSGNYDGYVGSQSSLAALRTATGDSNLEITTYTTSDYNPSGSNNTQSGGRNFIEFNKNASAGSLTATVTAPLGGTAWWFSVSCPGQQVIWSANGVTPGVQTNTESSITSSGFRMNGQTTSKGLTSNYSTTGTISARGFVHKTGATSTEFLQGDSGVTTHISDNNDTIGTFSRTLGSLSSSTTYSYRAYATNTAGTTYGAIETATTSASLTSFAASTSASLINVCSQDANQTYYHNGSLARPTVNDNVYTDSSGNNPLAAGYYRFDAIVNQYFRVVGVAGQVSTVDDCDELGSP